MQTSDITLSTRLIDIAAAYPSERVIDALGDSIPDDLISVEEYGTEWGDALDAVMRQHSPVGLGDATVSDLRDALSRAHRQS